MFVHNFINARTERQKRERGKERERGVLLIMSVVLIVFHFETSLLNKEASSNTIKEISKENTCKSLTKSGNRLVYTKYVSEYVSEYKNRKKKKKQGQERTVCHVGDFFSIPF